jgi:hypothetical protein
MLATRDKVAHIFFVGRPITPGPPPPPDWMSEIPQIEEECWRICIIDMFS